VPIMATRLPRQSKVLSQLCGVEARTREGRQSGDIGQLRRFKTRRPRPARAPTALRSGRILVRAACAERGALFSSGIDAFGQKAGCAAKCRWAIAMRNSRARRRLANEAPTDSPKSCRRACWSRPSRLEPAEAARFAGLSSFTGPCFHTAQWTRLSTAGQARRHDRHRRLRPSGRGPRSRPR